MKRWVLWRRSERRSMDTHIVHASQAGTGRGAGRKAAIAGGSSSAPARVGCSAHTWLPPQLPASAAKGAGCPAGPAVFAGRQWCQGLREGRGGASGSEVDSSRRQQGGTHVWQALSERLDARAHAVGMARGKRSSSRVSSWQWAAVTRHYPQREHSASMPRPCWHMLSA